VPCIDIQIRSRPGRFSAAGAALLLALLAGCANQPQAPAVAAAPPSTTAAKPALALPPVTPAAAALPNAPQPAAAPAVLPAPKAGAAPRYVTLAPASVARSWLEFKTQAAKRLVAAHPDTSYMSRPPDILLAIPVLEVELNGDGSVRKVNVLREPREAKDTIQLAVDAVRRAGPYGDVSRLPKPWKFVETFLFNDDRRFKPRTLD
jgi:hypothetical protein